MFLVFCFRKNTSFVTTPYRTTCRMTLCMQMYRVFTENMCMIKAKHFFYIETNLIYVNNLQIVDFAICRYFIQDIEWIIFTYKVTCICIHGLWPSLIFFKTLWFLKPDVSKSFPQVSWIGKPHFSHSVYV